MSPRKARYQVPGWVAQSIRDKRKKLLHGPYDCPKCKMNKMRIQVDKERKEVVAICSCGVECPLKYIPAFEAIDYYNKFMDQINKKK
jgi:transcription elongation factor Elf1